MVLFEVDRKKEIIKFTLSDSPCAIRLQPLGLRGKCIAMNRHRFKEMGMPLGYYNLKHQTLKTFTFQKQAPSS